MGATPGDLQQVIHLLICKIRKQRWWTLESVGTRLKFGFCHLVAV